MTADPTIRIAFEKWYSDDWKTPKSVERDGNGGYKYMGAHSAWAAWEAASRNSEGMATALRVIHTWASVPGALKESEVRVLTSRALSLRPNALVEPPTLAAVGWNERLEHDKDI